jgi:uncharacterized BrkB/YihY/UPF0761 family membrane protein
MWSRRYTPTPRTRSSKPLLAVALWSASAYVGAFIPAANIVWQVDDAGRSGGS